MRWLSFVAGAALLAGGAGRAAAQQYQTLNTNQPSAAWNTTAAAWSAGSATNVIGSTFGSAWANGNFATFARGSQAVTVTAPVSAAGLQFVAGAVTIGGSSAITLSYTSPFIDNRGGGASTISAPLAGTSGLVAYGAAGTRLTLAGASTYTGTTTASLGGTLVAGSGTSGSFGAFGSVNNDLTVNGGAAADLGGFAVGVGALGGSGAVTNSSAAAATLTAGNGGAGAAFGGSLTGNLGLAKVGAGTLTLTGTNTYAGPTAVSGGTLVAASASGSATGLGAVTVSGAGSTLAGTGFVGGAVTVGAGGTLAPGVSGPGNLTLVGGLTFAGPSSTFAAQLNGSAAGAGYDRATVAGGVTLNGAALSLSLGYTPADGDRLFLIANDGSDAVSGRFGGLPDGQLFAVGGRFAVISYLADLSTGSLSGGNDVAIAFTPVPEPAGAGLAAAAGLGALRLARRRVRG